MTQGLLDTATLLLNSTKSEINLGANSKNYTETFSNGKSFNDIFSNANNNYMKTSKTNYSDAYKKNSGSNNGNNNNNNSNNNDFGNNKLKDLNSSNTNKKESTSTVDKSNLNRQNSTDKTNTTGDKNSSVQDNKNVSNNETKSDTNVKSTEVNDSSKVTASVNETNNTAENTNETTINLSNIDTLNSIEDMDVLSDLQNLDELLSDALAEDDTVQPDFYINAFYQSTLDSLNQNAVQEEIVNTAVETETLLADETTVSTLNDNEEVNLIAEDITSFVDEKVSETTKSLTDVNTENVKTEDKTVQYSSDDKSIETELSTTKTDKTETDKNTDTTKDNLKKSLKEAETSKTSTTTKTEQDDLTVAKSDLKTTGVEVDNFTGEENPVNDDVLVKVTDNVAKNVPVIDVTKTDSKLSFREVMEKAGLDEAKLEALNLTVTSAGGEASSDGTGFGQSSAQEDLTRLALEVNAKKDSVNVQNKDFSKAVNSKQIQEEQPKETSKNDILSQINNKLQAQNINGTKKITLQLTPESLGKITVEIMKGKDGLQAKMLTDNFQVKELLEKNIEGLKSTLANQGVTVNNVSVKVASASESSSEFSFGRDTFNGENSQEQNFAGTGDKKGEHDSRYEQKSGSDFAMNEDENKELSTEGEMISEIENAEIENEEKITVDMGNVDIEV